MVLSLVDARVCPSAFESALLDANADGWVLSIENEITALYDMRAWQPAALEKYGMGCDLRMELLITPDVKGYRMEDELYETLWWRLWHRE